MVIKVIKKDIENNDHPIYRSSKIILTSSDIKKAEKFDLELKKTIKKLEHILLSSGILLKRGQKKDPLVVWYKIGTTINNFCKKYPVKNEDEKIFWDNFYQYNIIHKSTPTKKISLTRNDFKISSLLSRYSMSIIKRVGSWSLWREILSYKSIMEDDRILDWVIKALSNKPTTRDGTRPLLKAIAKRFKRIDTTILTNKELFKKIKESEQLIEK